MELYVYISSPIMNINTDFFSENEKDLVLLDGVNLGLKLENLNINTIELLIVEHIKNVAPENFSEELLPLSGGIFLNDNGCGITAQCCSDISNVENWREILQATNTNWQTMWVGHPEVAYKIIDDTIYFSDYIEPAENQEIKIKLALNKNIFFEILSNKLSLFDVCKLQFYHAIDICNFENKEALKQVLF